MRSVVSGASMRWLLGGYFGGLLILCIWVLGFLVYEAVASHLEWAATHHLEGQIRGPIRRLNFIESRSEHRRGERRRRRRWSRRPEFSARSMRLKAPDEFFAQVQKLSDEMAGPGVVINIYDGEGQPLARSGFRSGRFPLDTAAFQALLEGETSYVFRVEIAGREWQCLAVPVFQEKRMVAVVQAATLWDPSASVLDGLRGTLLTAGLLLIPLALLLTNGLAKRLAAPLEEVSEAADRLSEGDLRTRVEEVAFPSELSRLSKSFNSMVEQLGKSARAQKQFVADASHELKTPLTSIRGMAELLQRGVGDSPEKFEKLTRTIESEVDRMEALVSDLLLLSRPADEEGQSDLVEVARQMLETARLTATGLELTFEGEGSARVGLHPQRLERLVRNLIDNAVKYTPQGGQVRVSVSVKDGAAELRVADTGVGLKPEELDKVFDRFYRADHSRSRATGGTGLGLAIVQSLAEDAGGTVKLVSEPGVGTEAQVRLPLVI